MRSSMKEREESLSGFLSGEGLGFVTGEDENFGTYFAPKITNWLKKVRFFAFFCRKFWSYQKKAVLLHQQTYPASRKISALRVSLFCKYGTLYIQTTIVSAADRAAKKQRTQFCR